MYPVFSCGSGEYILCKDRSVVLLVRSKAQNAVNIAVKDVAEVIYGSCVDWLVLSESVNRGT